MADTTSNNSHTSSSNACLLHVLQKYSSRCQPRKRSREQAFDCLTEKVPLLLMTTGSSSSSRSSSSSTTSPSAAKASRKRPAPTTNDNKETTNTTATTTNVVDSSTSDISQHHQQQVEANQQEIEQQTQATKEFLQEVVDTWGVYRHGLQTIGGLTELSQAPDAIMPGNW